PPRVVIRSPSKVLDHVTQPRYKVEAQAEAAAGQPVDELLLLLDDRPFQPPQKAAPAGGPNVWEVDLTPGTHRLRVLARSQTTSGTSHDVEVTSPPAGGAPQRQRPPAVRPGGRHQ